jgi:hypothetical protein
MDPPRLEIAAGRRARRPRENLAHDLERHRGRQERPAAEPGRDGITYMHENALRDSTRNVAGLPLR